MGDEMIVAIHQPNFLPWIGYFYKMAMADVFVFLDNVPFSKSGFTNRVKIKTAKGSEWLTVPVLTKGKLAQPVRRVTACSTNWKSKIVKTLEHNYRKSPYYSVYSDQLSALLHGASDNLADLNIKLIQYLAEILKVDDKKVFRSSEMDVAGESTGLLIDVCQKLGADVYLSGSGGRNYQEETAFQRQGLKLAYSDFVHPFYLQRFGSFVGGLSVLDFLFNCGSESGAILRRSRSASPKELESGRW